ncbi:hypothetical protein MF622_10305 [Paenibacillus polymyxa]|nr:hypothetical protein [Paenibacillus polymyxa]WDZ55120.1 hypothetical protein MF622_10305 [Paenibacillus polymyxa]
MSKFKSKPTKLTNVYFKKTAHLDNFVVEKVHLKFIEKEINKEITNPHTEENTGSTLKYSTNINKVPV